MTKVCVFNLNLTKQSRVMSVFSEVETSGHPFSLLQQFCQQMLTQGGNVLCPKRGVHKGH